MFSVYSLRILRNNRVYFFGLIQSIAKKNNFVITLKLLVFCQVKMTFTIFNIILTETARRVRTIFRKYDETVRHRIINIIQKRR